MNLKELISDTNGSLSHTKLWSNIAYATACTATIMNPSPEMVGVMLAGIVLGRTSSKYLDTKSVSTGE
jgi:hypothetical protein